MKVAEHVWAGERRTEVALRSMDPDRRCAFHVKQPSPDPVELARIYGLASPRVLLPAPANLCPFGHVNPRTIAPDALGGALRAGDPCSHVISSGRVI